ncbi:hypothetical protein [Mycolicibacterium fortuitum]|uniref:hypothetical protein n=2 Tax=Mycolicibacterium fortuitum TaxID=1766 RepID=UPI0026344F74|nr:hypothetical protein [Mycolicibacterium fortuitum]
MMNGIYELAVKPIDADDLNILRLLIAQQLAAGHGRAWEATDIEGQALYLADAEEVVNQGLGSYWQDPGWPPAVLSPEMEAEVFAFDQAVAWFYRFLDERHGHAPGDHPAAAFNDPVDWDAWVTVLCTTSELVRRAWSRRVVQQGNHNESVEPASVMGPMSTPDHGSPEMLRSRVAAAIGATLAHRHGRRWMDLPQEMRDLYLLDAYGVIDKGLSTLN